MSTNTIIKQICAEATDIKSSDEERETARNFFRALSAKVRQEDVLSRIPASAREVERKARIIAESMRVDSQFKAFCQLYALPEDCRVLDNEVFDITEMHSDLYALSMS